MEGTNTKVKLIKRQMYGQAGFALLRPASPENPARIDHRPSPPDLCQSLKTDPVVPRE
jgi:hypothetical protein